MMLYSDPSSFDSHRVRIVIAEKDISMPIQYIGPNDPVPEDLLDVNNGKLPTFTDRDLVLWNAQVIMEYLDERFPHPTLMPIDPVMRGHCRLMLHRLDRDIAPLLTTLDNSKADKAEHDQVRKRLAGEMVSLSLILKDQPFFMSNDYTLVDASLAALLWRCQRHNLSLPQRAKPVMDYASRVFARPAFRRSLSDVEFEYAE